MLSWLKNHIDIETIVDTTISYIPTIIASVLLALFFWGLLLISRRLLSKSLGRTNVSRSIQNLMMRFLKYGIVAFALLTIANQLGFNITALVTGLGIAGLAISLAAQDTITNIIAGITLAIDRPFEPDDWIRIGDIHAEVQDIKLRTTVLTTFDNETIVVPNKDIASERIVNYTLTQRIRVKVPVGIAYKENIDEARETLLNTLSGDSRIMADPPPVVLVQELSDSSVDMELRFWIEDPWNLFPMYWEYIEKCKEALDAADIEIPFPHLQLFLEKSDGLTELKRQ